jgi:CheY-like chemotaxis protein
VKRIGNTGEVSASEQKPKPLVLYVEDDPANQTVAASKLKRKYDVIIASTSTIACHILESRGKDLAFILMDIELKESELNGVELALLIRGKLGKKVLPDCARRVPVLDVPILFVTAYGQKYDSELLMSCGSQVIDKPVDFVELETCMTRIKLEQMRKRSAPETTGKG